MTSLSNRRGTGRSGVAAGTEAGVPVGHVYLDVRRRLLYCLDETARGFQNEGVPFTTVDPSRQALTSLSGYPVGTGDLPLVIAWHEGRAAEAVFVLARKGSAVQHLQWSAAPLSDAHGQVVAVVGSVMLRPPEPDWQMLAGLAHDLRNPLQALRLSLDELPAERMPEEAREPLSRVRRAAERALSVGKDLLEWARGPAQGGRRVEAAWVPLEPLLVALAEEQAVAARQKGLVLVQDLRAVRGWEIQSDRVRLSRLLANLLSNAVRYTPTGRVEFSASWRQEGAARQLCLGVNDTGSGISPEEQESIFQPFERGSAGKGDSSGGSGLGLAVVDRLVQELHLTLELSSDVGRGSSFHLLVPAPLLRPSSL
ncbi:MAG TPA: HAMP domain-containing sensor histidine kinase [Gemmataceae bacterium]|nr:HAMP domain-containing sensor histidine kinase [Gemmataceae bacterium]